jgi:glycosyltransferase involved in cell wall biosynthesis
MAGSRLARLESALRLMVSAHAARYRLLMLSGDSSIARGINGAFYQMLERFAPYWERIDILTPPAPDASERVIHDNVYVHPSTYHRLLQPFFIQQKGSELLKQRSYDLLTSHDYGFFLNGIGAQLLLRGHQLPLVSEIHHVEGYPQAVTLRERLWRAAAMRYLPFIGKRAAALRVVNHDEVPALLRRLGIPAHRILVLYSLYLDFDIYHPLPDLKLEYDVLFVGRLASNKGILLLLEAIAQVQRIYPAVKLAIRGEGALRPEIEKRAAALGISANIHFIPRLSEPAEMAALYCRSRMLVCASTVEGNPRVTIEAMACGVPVLSTPVGIMPEVIQHGKNGFLFHWDARELAAQICDLLADDQRRQQIGTAGQQSVQRFDADEIIEAYARAYHRIIETN